MTKDATSSIDTVKNYRFTRAGLITDGQLIDVTEQGRRAGFRLPVAISAAVHADCVEWTHHTGRIKRVEQSEAGRLAALLRVAVGVARAISGCSEPIRETVYGFNCVPPTGPIRSAALTYLKIVIAPGDQGEPVVTIMLPEED